MGLAVSGAFADESAAYSDYAEERGMATSPIPPSVDESGTVRSPTSLDEDYDVADLYDPDLQEHSLASLDGLFERFDANRDEMIGPQEAKADANLERWFEWADRNQSNELDREEFGDAVVASSRMSEPPRS
jgi:hypothetical protein